MAGAVEIFKEWPKATKNYIGELQNEMKRVTWPNSKQVQSTTIVVILTVFAFAAFFEVVDTMIFRTVTKFYDVMTK
jgi:preprotein translocase subunit SecE